MKELSLEEEAKILISTNYPEIALSVLVLENPNDLKIKIKNKSYFIFVYKQKIYVYSYPKTLEKQFNNLKEVFEYLIQNYNMFLALL
jgi:hypothetical protein